MRTLREYNKKTFIGIVDGEKIYLTAPSWDCGWYWGFGYLGNKNCHYHVDGINKNTNLHDALKEHFKQYLVVRPSHLWRFAELFQSFYKLREAAEILGRGGAHLTANPCAEVIKNPEETNRINSTVLPAIFDGIYKILEMNADNEKLFKELVRLNLKGDTKKVVKFMFDNDIHTDDLKSLKDSTSKQVKNLESMTDHDIDVIHTEYWRQVHAKK